MNFKKKVNGSWADTPHYIHKTDTDTITTLPADIFPNAATATVGLKGNAQQNGTPTPQNPVMPQETGERTGNLWSYQPDTTSVGVTLHWDGEKIVFSNTCTSSYNLTFNYGTLPAGTYTLKANANHIPVDNINACIDLYQSSPFFQQKIVNNEVVNGTVTFTLTSDLTDARLRIRLEGGVNYDGFTLAPMLNTGSEPLPHEPFGYKIPISSAGQTTPVYLGEVETTRRIKKLVLTGTDADGEWKKSSTRTGSFYLNIGTNATVALGLCDRAVNVGTVGQYDSIGKMFVESSGLSKMINLWLFDTNISLDDFKSYLAQQYAAGTPVTVWYVLATEETGIVNEPLMKIGEYADEVSNVSIPTIAGANSFDVLTTLKPSEVSLAYTGWHDAMVKEWDGSQWQ